MNKVLQYEHMNQVHTLIPSSNTNACISLLGTCKNFLNINICKNDIMRFIKTSLKYNPPMCFTLFNPIIWGTLLNNFVGVI